MSASSPADFSALLRELRQTFLEEEAPGLLQTLQSGLAQTERDYAALMRAAHTLKGGAGTFQMTGVQTAAHRLEDLLEQLGQRPAGDLPGSEPLLQQGVEELAWLLDNPLDPSLTPNPDWLAAVDTLLAEYAVSAALDPTAGRREVLTGILEDCLQIAEGRLRQGDVTALADLVEQADMIGAEMDLPWLLAAVQPLHETPDPSLDLGLQVLQTLRQEQQAALAALAMPGLTSIGPAPSVLESPPVEPEPLPETATLESEGTAATPQVRIPRPAVELLANTGGDLILYVDKLSGQQQQMGTVIQSLRVLVDRFEPIRDQMEDLYEQLAIQPDTLPEREFDPLELDRFTALHESLQACQELMAQIAEHADDLNLLQRSTTREVVSMGRSLKQIYTTTTQVRLRPFQTLAQPFQERVRRLAQRYGKQVAWQVEGGDVLLDRFLLEELQGPLTHLVNNAFDHGIEPAEERQQLGKPPLATITIRAQIQGNQALITLRDDGRGIDLARVYQKAVERGLTQQPMAELTPETILGFLFESGFSTRSQVSELSGRGVGLDAVRTTIRDLGGSVQVESQAGRGTQFSLRLPVGLSLLPLLVVQAQGRPAAFLTDHVLDILRSLPTDTQETVAWQGQTLPAHRLNQLAPYAQGVTPTQPQAALILAGPAGRPLALLVEELSEVRQLIVKPLDEVFTVPSYLAGATVLPSGACVPVLLPAQFQPTPTSVAVAERPAGPRSILVAEDSVYTRRFIQDVLQQAGYAVQSYKDGQEAWEALTVLVEQGEVALVLTDLEMPRLNGLDLLAQIRSHTAYATLPVVMLTSRTGNLHRQKAAALGVSSYLGKPCNPQELLATVQSFLGGGGRP
ncbi:MAG: hybrid sensor histidine kinase/response regulator [Gloeomargaritaceae cyanobacterium C42_A2020_066]|nr:hybrid sensor histidine kinase/response regulator [Gloeomargaritaceae cyanobacterium C42_A2020_066]